MEVTFKFENVCHKVSLYDIASSFKLLRSQSTRDRGSATRLFGVGPRYIYMVNESNWSRLDHRKQYCYRHWTRNGVGLHEFLSLKKVTDKRVIQYMLVKLETLKSLWPLDIFFNSMEHFDHQRLILVCVLNNFSMLWVKHRRKKNSIILCSSHLIQNH